MSDKPTLTEAAAVFSAVETFHRKLHPRKRRLAKDLPALMAELADALERVRAVTGDRAS